MQLLIVGRKQDQADIMKKTLEGINNQFQYIDIEKQFYNQINNCRNNLNKSTNACNQDIIYLISKNQQNVKKVLDYFRNQYLTQYKLILLIIDDKDKIQAEKMQNQLNYKFLAIQIIQFVQYFQQIFVQKDQIDLQNKEVAIMLSEHQNIQTNIQKQISQQIFEEKSIIVNTEACILNSDVDVREKSISQLKSIFSKFQNQITLFFIIIEYQRIGIMKKNFMNFFSYLKKFQTKIIVLVFCGADDVIEEEDDNLLRKFFLQTAKVRNMYYLKNSQLIDKDQLVLFFQTIFSDQSNISDVGIDLTETIFEKQNEDQLKQERDQFSLSFQIQSLEQKCQLLEQDIKNGSLSIEVCDNQIRELYNRRFELEKKKNNDQFELTKKLRELEKVQKQFDQVESNLNKIALQETQVNQQQKKVIQNFSSVKVDSYIQEVKIDNFRNLQNEIEQLKNKNTNLFNQVNENLEQQEKIKNEQPYQQKKQMKQQTEEFFDNYNQQDVEILEKKNEDLLCQIEENNQKIQQLEQEDNYQNKKYQQQQPQQFNPSSTGKFQKNQTSNYQSKQQLVS